MTKWFGNGSKYLESYFIIAMFLIITIVIYYIYI